MRLLITEDHDLVREGLRAVFEETDIDVIGEAASAADAVRLVNLTDAEVMLLDITLPDGDGFGVLRDVKTSNQVSRLSCIHSTIGTIFGNVPAGWVQTDLSANAPRQNSLSMRFAVQVEERVFGL